MSKSQRSRKSLQCTELGDGLAESQKEGSDWRRLLMLIDTFIKYNTAITSSATVERLCSVRKDIFRAKTATLSVSDHVNSERLVFVKGNNVAVVERSRRPSRSRCLSRVLKLLMLTISSKHFHCKYATMNAVKI